jgi:hypothetical protein
VIIKIDHIAFGSSRFEDDLQRFVSFGYEVQFKEMGLKDLQNKRPFMKEFSGHLDMALLSRSGSVGIELLNHGHTVTAPSYVTPVFEGPDLKGIFTGETVVAEGRTFRKTDNGAEIFFIAENHRAADFRCHEAVIATGDLGAAIKFWNTLGFKLLNTTDQSAHLEFKPLFGGGTCGIYLHKVDPPSPRCWLDTAGFNCLALFSSDAMKDRKRFEESGLNPSPANPFCVGGKDLSIFWVQGPGGEVAEIIGLAKPGS